MATNQTNAFETTLRIDMGSTDLVAAVQSTDGAPASPCYLVIEPTNADRREYILFDGTFTADQFVTSTTDNRYLMPGSAATSGLTHPAGSVVRFAPVAQHFTDLSADITSEVSSHVSAEHNNLAKIAYGSYTGDDTDDRLIDVGFDPIAVEVVREGTMLFFRSNMPGGVNGWRTAGDGTVAMATNNGDRPELATGGFTVSNPAINDSTSTFRWTAYGAA